MAYARLSYARAQGLPRQTAYCVQCRVVEKTARASIEDRLQTSYHRKHRYGACNGRWTATTVSACLIPCDQHGHGYVQRIVVLYILPSPYTLAVDGPSAWLSYDSTKDVFQDVGTGEMFKIQSMYGIEFRVRYGERGGAWRV